MNNRKRQAEGTTSTTRMAQQPDRAPQAGANVRSPVMWQTGSVWVPPVLGSPAGVLMIQQLKGNRAVGQVLAVQRDDEAQGTREPSDSEIHSAAAEGIRTPATTLPFLDRIQASFGRYSIGHVKAHVGADAAKASRAMNALAFASGDHVVFGGTPDLRTAAHEAAHVVQQQAGVQLAGGIDRTGDAYERQADTVADAVVAGLLVEGLLEPFAAPSKVEQTGTSISAELLGGGSVNRWLAPAPPPTAPVQLRAENHYNRGVVDSPQVHHIISHSKFTNALAKIDEIDQDEVRREFMPSPKNITIRQLYNINNRFSFTNKGHNIPSDEQVLSRVNETFHPWTEKTLTQFAPNEIVISHHGLNYRDAPLVRFIDTYEKIRNGLIYPLSGFWAELKESYFEWSAGKLFYGPGPSTRAEPGGIDLDKFDLDAEYFRDPVHVAGLQQHDSDLEAAIEAFNTANANANANANVNVAPLFNEKQAIKNQLIRIGRLNRDSGVGPMHRKEKWVQPHNANQKALILELLPDGSPRKDFINSQQAQKVLPLEFIRPLLENKVYAAINNNHGELAEIFASSSGKVRRDIQGNRKLNGLIASINVKANPNSQRMEIYFDQDFEIVSVIDKKTFDDVRGEFEARIKDLVLRVIKL